MLSRSWGALRHAWARAIGWRHAGPIARLALAAAGLVVLAIIGRSAEAGAPGSAAPGLSSDPHSPSGMESISTPTPTSPATSTATPISPETGTPIVEAHRGPATPDDPVFLNTATADDLRRLPGIGAKRADAILALRAKLGRLRQIEDLLRVKGIGRATLKKLRPLVRVDPPAPANDGGARP